MRPCPDYCLNVMRGCLATQGELNGHWDEFVDALIKVGARLEGSFNIEEVVDPIAIQISDAIMNFQENGNAVSEKVFKGCGQPRLGKRSVSPASVLGPGGSPLSLGDTLNDGGDGGPLGGGRGGGKKDDLDPVTAAGTSIRRIVKDVREKIERLKGFWHELPTSVCSGESLATGRRHSLPFSAAPGAAGTTSGAGSGQQPPCWTGTERGAYRHSVVPVGLKNQGSNPEVSVDPYASDSLVNDQILDLKLITSKLLKAYDGVNVQWVDYEDWKSQSRWSDGASSSSSSSKSGGGSRDGGGGSSGPSSQGQFPYAYPWASGMAREEVEAGGDKKPKSGGSVEGSGDDPMAPSRVVPDTEGSGQGPRGPALSGTDLSHADDEDFPFVAGAGAAAGGKKKSDPDSEVEGSGLGPVPPPPPPPPPASSSSRPKLAARPPARPPAPPILGDPVHRVSSEEFDDFQRRYDDNFFAGGGDNDDGGSVGGGRKADPPQQPKIRPPLRSPASTPPPPVPAPTPRPPPRKGTGSGVGTSDTATSPSPRQTHSLLWSVFAPIFVTWIGGMVV